MIRLLRSFFSFVIFILLGLQVIAQPNISLRELLIQGDVNPSKLRLAKHLAINLGLPVEIELPFKILAYPAGIENSKPVYAVITNPAHPLRGGHASFYDDLRRRYDLSAARMRYGRIWFESEPHAQYSSVLSEATSLLLVPDWTGDRVLAFDPNTGNRVDSLFIPSDTSALASPKEALLHPVHNFITVSDQIKDLVLKFDPGGGTFLGWFAPARGVNTNILNNIRGHAYRPDNNLVVTVADPGNADAVAEFDTAGNYIGNFIANDLGGLNSPFGILFRTSDVLVTQSSTPTGVKQYDLNGGYIGQWATITSFPQQIIQLADGRIAVANFSGTGQTGIRLYTADGTFLRLLSGVTGNRGVYQLPNGNFLTTNGAGLHEIDSTTGNLVQTILSATNLQYITLYTPRTSAPLFGVSPSSIDFGRVTIGTAQTDSVTVTNAGTAPLMVSTVLSSDSSFMVNPMSDTIPPSLSSFFHITFAPISGGSRTADIVFTHNAATSPDTVIVQGRGNNAPSEFTLLNPPNGDTLTVADTLRYRWRRATDPDPQDTVHYTLHRSSDGGSIWQIIMTRDTSYTQPGGSATGSYIWRVYATDGYAVTVSPTYSYLVTQVTTVSEQPSLLPKQPVISQNYPNPFNAVTIIEFQLQQQAFVSLKIFNLLGLEVATLVHEQKEPGIYQSEWNAEGMPAGVYFYKIQVGQFTETKKLILLK